MLFQSLSQKEKIDFFVRCQEILIKSHSGSSFVIRERGLEKALDAVQTNIFKYQGFSYSDDNVCILWNYIFVSDPKDVTRAVKENAYKGPAENFNAVSIDFATFRKMEDIRGFIKENVKDNMKYVLFIREGNPKIYPIETLLMGIKYI